MANYIKIFFRRISKDFKQKELLPVKLLFFIQMSTILVLYPYLTIHMRELGINIQETAIMSAITPVVGLCMPPLAGMMADKIGNFKILLSIFSALGGIGSLLLLIVPVARITITYPENVVLGISCINNESMTFHLSQDFSCVPKSLDVHEVNISMKSCGQICQIEKNQIDIITGATEFRAEYKFGNKSFVEKHNLTSENIFLPKKISKTRNHETLKINDIYNKTVRKYTENYFYFPSNQEIDFECILLLNRTNEDLNYTNSDVICSNKQGLRDNFGTIFPELPEYYNATIQLRNKSEIDIIEKRTTFTTSNFTFNNETFNSICKGPSSGGEYFNVTINDLELVECEPVCLAISPRKQFCSNENTVIEKDVSLTFWSYLVIRVFIGIVGGTAYTMFEGAVIAILREYKADYGLQRVYASIGGMISSPFSGWLIDYGSQGKGYTNFTPVFLLYALLKIVSAGMMLCINLEFKSPAKSVFADVLAIMNVELCSLFVASFLLGSAWGYIENYLFWLLQDLGGTKSLMGLTVTVGGLVGIPVLVLSGPLIKLMGHANIIFIGFMAYGLRLIGYSLIYNPWLSLIFESMECLTQSLCFTAAVTYAARMSTTTTDTTIQGIFGGLFYGVGKSAGSLVGGYLIGSFGIRTTFQIFAIITAISGLLYLSCYHLYLKHNSKLTQNVGFNIKEEPPQSTENGDVQKKDEVAMNNLINSAKSMPYEDSLVNPAYEDTENTDDITLDDNDVPKIIKDRPRMTI